MFWGITLNLLLILLVYLPVLNGYFLGEDYAWWEYVQGKSFLEVLEFFWVSPSKALAGFYHPLVGLSYWLNVNFSFMSPLGFHLINLVLQVGVYLLVVMIAFYFFEKIWPSLLAGFLFSIFPFQSEAVAWIDGRHDLLMTLFYLLSFYLFLKSDKTNRTDTTNKKERTLTIFSIISFFLALSAKEMAVTLPVVLVVYLYFQEKGGLVLKIKKSLRKTIWFWLVLIFYFFLHAAYVGNLNPFGGASHLPLIISPILIYYLIFLITSVLLQSRLHLEPGVTSLVTILIGIFYLPAAFTPTQERYLYLPSTMVSIYLANLFYLLWQAKIIAKNRIVQLGIFLVLMVSGTVSLLYLENRVSDWKKASEIARKTVGKFKVLAQDIPTASTIYFFNLPDNYHGSYIFRTHVKQAMEYGTGKKFKKIVVLPTTAGEGDSKVEVIDKTRILLKSKNGYVIFTPTISRILPSGEKVIETEDYNLLVKNQNTLELTLKKDFLGKEKTFFFKGDTSLIEVR